MKVEWVDVPGAHSVYQSTPYGRASALAIGAEWDVLGFPDGSWRVPLSFKPVGSGGKFLDAVSPYGYPGIFAAENLDLRRIAVAWTETVARLREKNVVCAVFRFPPYREISDPWRHKLRGLDTVFLSETIAIPLGDEQSMWDAMEGRSRTAVRKAEREGLQVQIEAASESLANADSNFRRLYETTMMRVGASAEHIYPDAYYRELVSGLGEAINVATVFDAAGAAVASCILLTDTDGAHYHLSGADPIGAQLGANNLMIWSALKWAASGGHRIMHLGGGTKANDSLFRFKRSFGGEKMPYYIGKLVINETEYQRLLLARAAELAVSVSSLEASGFFPAYRARGASS